MMLVSPSNVCGLVAGCRFKGGKIVHSFRKEESICYRLEREKGDDELKQMLPYTEKSVSNLMK